MDPCCVAGPACALLFSLAACIMAYMFMRARIHEADARVQVAQSEASALIKVAQTEAHAAAKKGNMGSTVMPAWAVLVVGLGCSGCLVHWGQQRHQQAAVSISADRCTPENCRPPKKCNGSTCTTRAVTDGLAPSRPKISPSSVLIDELTMAPKFGDNPNRAPDGIN